MNNMKNRFLKFIDKTLCLNLEKSEDEVVGVKQNADTKMNEVTVTLKVAGKLQKQVMQRTNTYFLAKGAGAIK